MTRVVIQALRDTLGHSAGTFFSGLTCQPGKADVPRGAGLGCRRIFFLELRPAAVLWFFTTLV